ncbi:ABC transporter ATP-binding protein [Streptomyces formicae]|uniref:ABC transporter ATP-binding protein n=1 Tax=Streptomyces formicae TaxID=1616117 RepID=UPI00361DBC67
MAERSPSHGLLSATERHGVRLELDGITKVYPGQEEPAVESVSMAIESGELVCFVGPSGCGKTTTMKMINRLIEPTSGNILMDGEPVSLLNPHELRRRIGYVIQQTGLFPHMTIAQNIGVVPRMLRWPRRRIHARVDELLALVGLDPGRYRDRWPAQLSGGQQQRVGVARALAADPPIMLMDEPFGATDPLTRERLQDEFLAMQRRLGKTVVFVTHDFDEALKLGDRIAVLGDRSRIIQFDTPGQILTRPADAYVESLIGRHAGIRRLGLLTVSDTPLLPVSGFLEPSVTVDCTLREALDAMVRTGSRRVAVMSANEVLLGELDFDTLSKAIMRERGDG